MDTPPAKRSRTQYSPHARFWPVAAPVILMAILIPAGIVALAVWGLSREQFSIIGDVMFICLVICPMVVCLGVIYGVVLAGMIGLNILNGKTQHALSRIEQATRTMAESSMDISETVCQKSITLGTQFAVLDHLLDGKHAEEESQDGEQ